MNPFRDECTGKAVKRDIRTPPIFLKIKLIRGAGKDL